MYAKRYDTGGGWRSANLAAAVAINAGLIGALLFSAPEVAQKLRPKPFDTINIPIDPPPPLEALPQPEPRARQATRPMEQVDVSRAILPLPEMPYIPPPPLPLPIPGATGGADVLPVPIPSPTPIDIAAGIDPRYAGDFQPAYPPGERRAERSGRVVVRVLIGADGRVKQARRVSAASDAFWTATERQALGRWRFRPATRDGVAVESWRTMTVRFELED